MLACCQDNKILAYCQEVERYSGLPVLFAAISW